MVACECRGEQSPLVRSGAHISRTASHLVLSRPLNRRPEVQAIGSRPLSSPQMARGWESAGGRPRGGPEATLGGEGPPQELRPLDQAGPSLPSEGVARSAAGRPGDGVAGGRRKRRVAR
jgi:hypothetical protein